MFERLKRKVSQVEKRKDLTGQEYRKGNLPGTDTFDDGLDENDTLIAPGSTSTESGGTYMEDTGPRDLKRRSADNSNELGVIDPEVTITDSPDQDFDEEDDAAARWLRENDPNYKK